MPKSTKPPADPIGVEPDQEVPALKDELLSSALEREAAFALTFSDDNEE